MSWEQDIRNEQFKRATGSAPNFRAIDGVGPKTADKVKGTIIEGQGRVQAPTDVQDLTDDELADKADISKNRARKVIKGAGGNPDRKPRGTTGSVSAGGLADALDEQTRQAAEVVEQRREVFGDVVEAAAGVPDSRSRRRGDFGPLEDEDPQRVRELGRAADTFRRATDDPIDPTEEPRRFGFNGEEARERAGRLSTAAGEFLEQEEDLTFDEARSEITGQQPDLETVEQVVGSQRGPVSIFRGPTTPTDIGRTGTGRFDRPDTDPDVDPAPIARDDRTGRFGLDPFDITSSTAGVSVDTTFGGSNGGGALDHTGSSFDPDRDEREAIRQLERNSPGREAEQIEKVRLYDDPPEDALATFGEAADRVVSNRDEITDPDRTDTSFFESDTIDTIDRLRSEVR